MIFQKFKKPLILSAIALAVLIFAAGIFWQLSHSGKSSNNFASVLSAAKNNSANKVAQGDLPGALEVSPEDQITYNKEIIPLLWTDNNDNENLIIKTDKQYYDAKNETEVFFSVANQTQNDQKTDIYFWFDDGQKSLASVEKIENNQTSSPTGDLPKGDKLQITNSNKFSIPQFSNRKDIKGYTAGSEFQDIIKSGQINYYRAIINFPKGANGEFFIEAFGNNGGYGHLDPYYASGLVGYWSLNGADIDWSTNTAYDRSGSSPANNGTMVNMSTTTSPVAGISGQALNFDGVSNYVDAGTGATLNLTNVTVTAWIKTNTSGAGVFQYIADKSSGGNSTTQYELRLSNLNIELVIGNGSSRVSAFKAGLSKNTWYFVTGTFDGSNLIAYINAVSGTPTAFSGTQGATSASVQIGARSGTQGLFGGIIDEVRVYNRALSQSEIQQLYNAGAARMKINSKSSAPGGNSGLVGNWTFNGADIDWGSNTAYDRSGSSPANNGTITNMSTTTSPVAGISGQALNFDGVDDYVNITENSNLPIYNQTIYSVSAWVKCSAGQSNKKVFSEGDNINYVAAFSIGTALQAGSKKASIYIKDDASVIKLSYKASTLDVFDGTWHHITWIDNNGTAKLYVDGVQDSTDYNYTRSTLTLNTSSIGALRVLAVSGFFNGLIDEVRVYNRALTPSEITDLYRAGAARMKINSKSSAPGGNSGLVGNWTFNGADIDWGSNTAYDRSGSSPANNGTMINMSTTTSPVAGISGQALKFDNNSQSYVDAGKQSSLNNLGPMTISMWVNPKSYSFNAGILASKSAISTFAWDGWLFYFFNSSGYVRFQVSYDADATTISRNSSAGINLNKWQHVVVTWDGSSSPTNIRIYFNNVDVSAGTSGSGSIRDNDSLSSFGIGGNTSDIRNFNGLIDEVRVYNRALTASEIQALYNLGARRFKVVR